MDGLHDFSFLPCCSLSSQPLMWYEDCEERGLMLDNLTKCKQLLMTWDVARCFQCMQINSKYLSVRLGMLPHCHCWQWEIKFYENPQKRGRQPFLAVAFGGTEEAYQAASTTVQWVKGMKISTRCCNVQNAIPSPPMYESYQNAWNK